MLVKRASPGDITLPILVRTSHGGMFSLAAGRSPVRATRRMTTSPELRWKAHIFFSAKINIPRKLTYFLVLLQLAKRLCPFKLYRNSVQGGMIDAKSYFTNAQTHHDDASQMTDLSPDLTTCDTERRSPAHPPSGSRPQGWNNRVRPSPALRPLPRTGDVSLPVLCLARTSTGTDW